MIFPLRSDSYKVGSHYRLYPPDAEIVYSYLESRGGDYAETLFFGAHYYMAKYLEGQVFDQFDVMEAEDFCREHFGRDIFNKSGWMYILEKYQGHLPLLIKAVPEGTVVPVSNILMSVENTDPKAAWLTNFVESLLLKVWYPITVATISREIKKIILKYLEITGDPSLIDFMCNDFGYRGASSEETAAIGGAAHLISSLGSDNMSAIYMLNKYYNPREFPGFSIPASEHSTITSWGDTHEVDAMRHMLETYPNGTIACVSDSYDIFNACANIWGGTLKDMVLARDGVLVIRPDSGDPVPNMIKILNILGEKFGTTDNQKGFKMLHPKIRVIQGDGNRNPGDIKRMLDTMRWQGWSANNIAFGMGGGLLQNCNRDTQKFAFKCSAIRRSGVWHDVHKTAIGKESKQGRLSLIEAKNGDLVTVRESPESVLHDVLKPIFLNGEVLTTPRLEEIKERAAL